MPPEVVEEENWFFRLSRYAERLEDLIESDSIRVRPAERKREVLSFVRAGLRDFSVSRSQARARGWGVPVPEDPEQVVFVWFDALAGYLSATNSLNEPFRWQTAARRTHLLGKGIVRFHAVHWPAILLSAGLSPPTEVLVHGYVTVEGKKIGKSLGNAVDPQALIDRHGAEALRWFLLRHVHTTKDSDFSLARFDAAHDSELADQLGNLVSRALTLVTRDCRGRVPAPAEPEEAEASLIRSACAAQAQVAIGFEDFALQDAAGAALSFVVAQNRYLDQTAPWRLSHSPEQRGRLDTVLHHSVEALRVTSVLIAPLLPKTSKEIRERIGQNALLSWREAEWGRETCAAVHPGPPLFPKRSLRK